MCSHDSNPVKNLSHFCQCRKYLCNFESFFLTDGIIIQISRSVLFFDRVWRTNTERQHCSDGRFVEWQRGNAWKRDQTVVSIHQAREEERTSRSRSMTRSNLPSRYTVRDIAARNSENPRADSLVVAELYNFKRLSLPASTAGDLCRTRRARCGI